MVVLAGYKTVKEALVQRDEEFGERDTLRILEDFNNGHGEEMESLWLFVFTSVYENLIKIVLFLF